MGEIKKADVNRRLEAGAKVFGFVPSDVDNNPISGAPTAYFEAQDEDEVFEWLRIWSQTGNIAPAPFYRILTIRRPLVSC